MAILCYTTVTELVACTHRHDPNRVLGNHIVSHAVDQSIKVYTISPAYWLFKEDEIGSFEAREYADLLIISVNPYKIDPMKLDTDLKIMETYIGGQCTNVKRLHKRICQI